MEDRTCMVPDHAADNVLPNTVCMLGSPFGYSHTHSIQPLFSRLLRFAGRTSARIAIDDAWSNHRRTHLELLSHVLALRQTILHTIDASALQALGRGDEVYIAIVAAGGYEYSVAMLAVLALGAAAVPITPALPVEEAVYFVEQSRASLVLASSLDLEKCSVLEKRVASKSNTHFRKIAIGPSIDGPTLSATDILISSNRPLEEHSPAVVIFTSGTTGPPKGVVMRRSFVFDCALEVADYYRVTEDDVMLHVLPVHHATGVGINFFPFLITGARIEFRSGGFNEVWMWERWKQGAVDSRNRLTFFSGVPTIYMRMRRHYQAVLSKLPSEELAMYVAGARQFRTCLCGTSALPQPLADFWTTLMQKKILQRYGATEFGAIFKVRFDDRKVPDGSVGEAASGVDVKLSDGNDGEVLVRSPHMFSKYLNDPEATAKAHDAEGYFRTGDIARREGKYFYILGRASLDIIKSGGYKISALDIERELLALPYVAEAMVVGVADEEFGQRLAALISLQEEELAGALSAHSTNTGRSLTIAGLRRDLQGRLARYKMPTLLRIVEGELPKTATGKVQKKILGPKFFPAHRCAEVQRWKTSRPQAAKL